MNGVESTIPALPAEVLARIVASLVPEVDRNASTLPHRNGVNLESTPALPRSPNSDLLSVALTCRLLHEIASQILYRTPLLRTLKSLNLLTATIASEAKQQANGVSSSKNGESSRAAQIRSIQLPPGDGLLQPGDTLAEQTCYVDSLRILFDHAARIGYISLEHRPAGAALLEFLRPSTVCRPRRVSLSNLSFSAPPFSTTQSLAPLSQLTHLHLIKVVPPPALISFLVGDTITAEEQGIVPKSIAAGLSPRDTLECLRLSLLPADALVEFDAYITWRKEWKVYEKLSAQQQAREPAPRAPRAPARRFAVQEALYDLATHASRLTRLRLLILEMSPLAPLDEPNVQSRSMWRSTLRPANGRSAAGEVEEQRANVRATYADAHSFYDAVDWTGSEESLHARYPDIARDEDARIGERDFYWRQVEHGKLALINLWSTSQEPTSTSIDIRVVAARSNGHDRKESFYDFYCQAQHEPSSASSKPDGQGAGADEVGCWADPDVFSLVTTAPYFSFKSLGRSDSGWHWTGELPRQTAHPSNAIFPSIVFSSSML